MIEENEKACQWCGKEFKTLCDLRRHLVVHTGEKPFHCFYCDSAYSYKEKLRSHCITAHEMTPEEFKAKARSAFGRPLGRPPKKPRDYHPPEVRGDASEFAQVVHQEPLEQPAAPAEQPAAPAEEAAPPAEEPAAPPAEETSKESAPSDPSDPAERPRKSPRNTPRK